MVCKVDTNDEDGRGTMDGECFVTTLEFLAATAYLCVCVCVCVCVKVKTVV